MSYYRKKKVYNTAICRQVGGEWKCNICHGFIICPLEAFLHLIDHEIEGCVIDEAAYDRLDKEMELLGINNLRGYYED